MGVTVLFSCSLQTASLKRWTDCKTTCPVWVLLKDCWATIRIGLGDSVWMSKIVLDFACTEQHEMQKQTFDHRKAQCFVSKANLPWNFARKIEAIMSLNCAKKIKKKKRTLPPPTKKPSGLRIRKKHAESASAESKLRFLSTSDCHTAVWCRCYCIIDCKPKIKPTRCIISKQQTSFKFTLASSNQKAKASPSRTRFYQRARLRTKQIRTCCAHSPENSFDHSSIWWFSKNRVMWPGKWANDLT